MNKALILAGGFGTRLKPLTNYIPKPMIPLFFKPFLQYQIDLLRHHGIRDIIISTHHLPHVIENWFKDGSRWGVNIQYSHEDQPLGTAGAVKLAQPLFKDVHNLVVLNGDILTDLDITYMFFCHYLNKADVSIATKYVNDTRSYGLVDMYADSRIKKFKEKPDELMPGYVNAGIYILNTKLFNDIDPNINLSFEREVFPKLLAEDKLLYGYSNGYYWLDVGTPARYGQAYLDCLAGIYRRPYV